MLLLGVVIVIGVGAYFVFTNSYKTPTNPPPVQTETQTVPVSTAPVTNVTIAIQNFSFTPAALTVKSGTKVTWVNNDSASHTVTSDSGNLLDSPTLAPGQSFSFTFTQAGSVSYYCKIHPSMKGSVTIQN